MADDAPSIFFDPPIPTTTEFSTVALVRAVIKELDSGSLYRPALLLERMLWNPRLRGVLETRLNGLLSTEIRWEPARNNRDARRAAEALREDWPLMASHPARKQFAKWSLLLGIGVGQRDARPSPTSGRLVPVLRNYWPGWVYWYWPDRVFNIQTQSGKWESVPSLAGGGTIDPATSPWIISEPFGVHSWRESLIHATWRPWLGHEWAQRDQNRASEKHGIGALKALYPRGTGDEHQKAVGKFTRGIRTMGSEGVVPLEQRGEGEPNFGVEPLEFNGTGFAAIADAANANAVALAILFLGHNLTAEIKGGSFAAAGVADYIRDDVKESDSGAETAWARPQLVAPWALWNFGDPGLAPVPCPITDSPKVNQAQAQMYQALAQAITQLKTALPAADLEALAERFRIPLRLLGADQVQMPAEPAPEQPTTP